MISINMIKRDDSNFYIKIVQQYSTFFVKKMNIVFLKYRLKNNLQYDDICMIYMIAVIFEYVFIFD